MLRAPIIAGLLAVADLLTAAHYGDPNTAGGCMKGEVVVSLKGLSGNFCSPPCLGEKGHCPSDVPAGVTATPTCDVTIANVKFCSLQCEINGAPNTSMASTSTSSMASNTTAPRNQCGANASCKSFSGTTVCTYDDVPAPPSSYHWVPVNSPSFDALTTAMAVGFTPDGKVGFSGAGQDGAGAEIVKSTDSGKTWQVQSGGKGAFDIFLGTAVKNGTSVVVTGAAHNSFTTDGATFSPSKNLWLSSTPSVGIVRGGGGSSTQLFATAYATESNSGVGTSVDGKVWTKHSLTGLDPTYFQARYGSWPAECTWYLSAGAFPAQQQTQPKQETTTGAAHSYDEQHLYLNKHVRMNKGTGRAELARPTLHSGTAGGAGPNAAGRVADPVQNCSMDPTNCYAAAIAKTADCGTTWSTLYKNVNTGDNFYPNGIDCISSEHCIAVFEGDTCRVMVTKDGGKTWEETMHDTDPACSLVSVRMVQST